jgi:uncharacterized protein (TIGR02996 family)
VASPDDLLPAVLAAPDDDLPRLVYADALEERGDATRAEFIRVQIELARDPGRLDLKAREAALLAVHGKKWLAPLRTKGQALESRSTHGQFRRGFVEVVWMPAKTFVQRAKKLFDRTPARELRVVQISIEYWWRLSRCRHLSKLQALDLSDRQLGNAGILVLLHYLPNSIKILRLRACNLTFQENGIPILETRRRRRLSLNELDVSLNDLTPAVLDALRNYFGPDVVRFDPPPPTGSTPAPPGR